MLRTVKTLSLLAGASALSAASLGGGIGPAICALINNGNFNSGFAFWSPDVELGEFGDTSTNALVSADPLAFLPGQGNIATFFTEASADWECLTPNGSAASSTVVLSRTLLNATAPSIRFRYGAQYSFLVAGGGVVEYSIVAVFTNNTTGRMIKCPLSSGRRTSNSGLEGIIQVPFTTFTSCTCTGNGFISPGDQVELEVVFSVRADGKPVDSIAFIGGPGYSDDYQFCNVLCLEPVDPVDRMADGMMDSRPVVTVRDLGPIPQGVTGDELRVTVFDLDGDGEVTSDDIMQRINLNELINNTLSPTDLNGDGEINHADLEMMMRLLQTPDRQNPTLGDINADGKVDQTDLNGLLDAMR